VPDNGIETQSQLQNIFLDGFSAASTDGILEKEEA